jgi:hypothetical protein
MTKIIQMILSGVFFTFICDFFLFLGIYKNYIDKYGIDIYYNAFFAQNQNIILFFTLSIFLGYLIMYKSAKISIATISLLFLLSSATLIKPLGEVAGKALFMQEDISVKTKKFSYHGNLIYIGRKNIYFYDYELKKVIILNKNKILSE